MKNIFVIKSVLIILLLIWFFAQNPLNAEPRTVKVGIFPASPLVMINNNEPEGLFIDLINHFAESLDWNVKYIEKPWNELLVSLEKGDIDLLPAVGYTDERTKIFDFSKNPVYIDSGVLFTSPKFSLHTVFDLKDKRVAAVNGSIFTTAFIDYISSFGVHSEIILTKDNRAVMQAISDGTADAGVCIYSLGNELMHEFSVSITAISFSPIALEFAVPKGKNQDIINGIDRLMTPMINDTNSLYSKSFRKWTTKTSSFEIPNWIIFGVSILIGIGIFLGIWNFTLKHQVFLKTNHLNVEISERMHAEENLKKSLLEKETLIRELYHRTKNTMQVIQSMFSLQANGYPENKDLQLLVKSINLRIQAISLVHQMLYNSQDLSKISTKNYITNLSSLIYKSYNISESKIALCIYVDDQFFLLDTAIPLGLILNELITNSLKYAFPDNRNGTISIKLNNGNSNQSILEYSDNGIGVGGEFDYLNQTSLGLKLIHSIGESQLSGNVAFSNNNGVKCTITFSTELYNERVKI